MTQTDMELVSTLQKIVDFASTLIRKYTGDVPDVLHKDHPEVLDKVVRRICLQCGDEVSLHKPYRRGLCSSCYQATNRILRNLEATEAELFSKGLLTKDADVGGRRRRRTALDEYLELRNGDEPAKGGESLTETKKKEMDNGFEGAMNKAENHTTRRKKRRKNKPKK